MREIKFRFWSIENRVMYIEMERLWTESVNEWFAKTEESGIIVLQYTGLKDKNCKDIYEGDIVHEDCSNPNVNWTYEVYYDNEEAKFWCRNSEEVLGEWNACDDPAYPRWNSYEVIGNIYENEDLLKATI